MKDFLSISILILFLSGCVGSDNPEKLHLVFPEGYEGPVRLILMEGRHLKGSGTSITLQVPRSGVVMVAARKVLRRPTIVTATYTNGESIPKETFSTESIQSDDSVLLRSIGSTQRNGLDEYWMVVGTSEGVELAREQMQNKPRDAP